MHEKAEEAHEEEIEIEIEGENETHEMEEEKHEDHSEAIEIEIEKEEIDQQNQDLAEAFLERGSERKEMEEEWKRDSSKEEIEFDSPRKEESDQYVFEWGQKMETMSMSPQPGSLSMTPTNGMENEKIPNEKDKLSFFTAISTFQAHSKGSFRSFFNSDNVTSPTKDDEGLGNAWNSEFFNSPKKNGSGVWDASSYSQNQ